MDYNTMFNTSGRLAAEADFWSGYEDAFDSAEGIIPGFKTVLGEQYIHVRDKAQTPFYSAFIGRPMTAGSAWMERVTAPQDTVARNGKATAEDALKHYDSKGYEAVFSIGFNGRKSVSCNGDLDLNQLVNKGGQAGRINEVLLDSMQMDVQYELEADAGINFVSSIAKETTVNMSDGKAVRKMINQTANAMMASGVKYSEKGFDYIRAPKVLCFIDADDLDALYEDKAFMPSPNELNMRAELIPVVGGLPTPVSAEQYAAGGGHGPYTKEPKAKGKAKPSLIMCDSRYFEIRPYINEWKVTSDYNGAGDFRNYHILFEGAMGVKPWCSAVRINNNPKV